MSDALLRRREVERRVGMRKSAIYAKIAAGLFPRPVHRGASALWVESEIEAHIEALVRERDEIQAQAFRGNKPSKKPEP